MLVVAFLGHSVVKTCGAELDTGRVRLRLEILGSFRVLKSRPVSNSGMASLSSMVFGSQLTNGGLDVIDTSFMAKRTVAGTQSIKTRDARASLGYPREMSPL